MDRAQCRRGDCVFDDVMQKLWNWFVDKKSHTVRKWRSAVLGAGGGSGARRATSNGDFKANGGSAERLENARRCTSALLAVPRPRHAASANSLHDSTLDYEEFFDESASAAESALDRKSSVSSLSVRDVSKDTSREELPNLSEADEHFNDPSCSSESRVRRRSESARLLSERRRPRSRSPSGNYSFIDSKPDDGRDELYDDFEEILPPTILKPASPGPRKRASVPQVSVSFADDPSSTKILFDKGRGKEKRRDEADDTEVLSSSLDSDRRKFAQMQMRRQSNIQVLQSVSGRRTSTTLLPLTAAQIHLVRSLWRQVYITKGPTVIGSALFHRIFFKSVRTKEQFRRCKVPAQFPNHDSFSKAHCKAAAELIFQVVENLENLEVMSEQLTNVGIVHAKISGGELSGKLWNLVAETFIDCTLEWGDKRCRSETVRKAWALIIAFMIEKIKEGHTQQRRHMSQLKLSTKRRSIMSAEDNESR